MEYPCAYINKIYMYMDIQEICLCDLIVCKYQKTRKDM